ncbi:MAG: PD40 domain-containing protein [Chitinophagaceae bacterium]|nr:PD40 domain-containing protein [Chitinophagaceae bacterium]
MVKSLKLFMVLLCTACAKHEDKAGTDGKAGILYYASFKSLNKLNLQNGQVQSVLDIASLSHPERFDVSKDGTEILFYEESLNSSDVTFRIFDNNGQLLSSFRVGEYVSGIPRLSPDRSKLAFIWKPANTYPRQFIAIFSRTGQQVTSFENVSDYAWLPDGRLLMVAPGGFYLSDQQLARATKIADISSLPGEPSQLDISADGTQVLFVSNYHIWHMKTNGTGMRQLTSSPNREWYPSWMPDGKQFLFTLDWTGNCKEVRIADMAEDMIRIDPHSDAIAPRILLNGDRICASNRPVIK